MYCCFRKCDRKLYHKLIEMKVVGFSFIRNAVRFDYPIVEAILTQNELMFIPRSHKKGAIEAKHDLTTTSYPLWVIDNDTIAKLVKQGGIVAPKGGPGSAILFHGTLVHGSPPNMSPWDRQIIYVTYNSVQNAIRRFKRPAYIAHRDFTPLDAWEDDAVIRAVNAKVAAE